MTERETLLDPILQELEAEFQGIQVVALGGGHGLSQALIAIQRYATAITAIVSVADDGGSSGRLAPALDIPPPGDIRRCLIALSPDASLWKQLLEYRFEDGDVSGHSLGNLMLAALTDLSGDFQDALRTAGRLLGARGAVVPVADQALLLEADVDGTVVRGQVNIALSRGHISDIRLLPEDVHATREAVQGIEVADQIVIGPGSLFTSLIANLKVPGIAKAINYSGAQLVYVCNVATQDGETLDLPTVSGHVEALCKHTGLRLPDVVVAQDPPFRAPEPIRPLAFDRGLDDLAVRVERADIVDLSGRWPQHDPVKLATVLGRLA